MNSIIIDMWNVVTSSFSSPFQEKSFPRTSNDHYNNLAYQSLLRQKNDEESTKEYIDFLKKQIEILREEARKKDNLNLSVTYQCILLFCGMLIIAAFIGLFLSAFLFDETLSYSQIKLVDICVILLTNVSAGFVGLLGGKIIK